MAIPSARASRPCGLGAKPGTISSTARHVLVLGFHSLGRRFAPEDRGERPYLPLSESQKKSCRHDGATERRRSCGATGEQVLGERTECSRPAPCVRHALHSSGHYCPEFSERTV